MSDLVYLQKIAENQTGRTTWIAKYKGIKCIAKKIVVDKPEKRAALIKQLQGQVTFSERLSGTDRQQIILFNQMIEDDGAVVFLRDFVDGESLENLIPDKGMKWEEAVTLMKSIASIVQRSHDNYHVIHGDLKPANILQRGNDKSLCIDKPKCIIDWDTMRISEQVNTATGTPTVTFSNMPGTPEYMSPEQCAGKRCTSQTDVYALGVILYRLLTGDFPFTGLPMQIISQKQQEVLPPFLNRYPTLGVPTDLGKLVDDSLQKDLNKRVRNIDEFIERLDRIIDDNVPPVIQQPSSSNHGNSQNSSQIISEESQEELSIVKKAKDDSTIAIIGPTQSGKTVLAAGLYRSHTDAFNVSALDDKTRQYADQIGSFLQSGNWPAATTKNERIPLKFKLDIKDRTGTHSGIVEFKEYSGEDIRKKNFCQDIIGNAEVVLMLFNPGTPWIADMYPNKQIDNPIEKNDAAYHLNEFINQMKRCINHMASLSNRPAIAVVITAADRLQSDLKPHKEDFEKVVSEICTALTLNKLTWKRFEVSVCKPLEKQDELTFDPQHIQEPFVWAFNRKRARRILKKSVITVVCLICALLLCLAVFGLTSYSESKKSGLISQEVAQLDKTYTNRISVVKQKEYVDKLKEVWEKNKSHKFWLAKYRNLYEIAKNELGIKISAENVQYFDLLLAELDKLPDDKKEKKDKALALQMDIDSCIDVPQQGPVRNHYHSVKDNVERMIARIFGDPFEVFKRKIQDASAINALEFLKDWIMDNGDNPNLSEAEQLVYNIVIKDMKNCIEKCLKGKDNQPDYMELKNLCAKVKSTTSAYIRKQSVFTFAYRYFEWMENPEGRKYTIKVTSFKAKSKHSLGGDITEIYDSGGSWKQSCKDFDNEFVEIENKFQSRKREPWEEYTICIVNRIDVNGWFNKYQDAGNANINIHPRKSGNNKAYGYSWNDKENGKNTFMLDYTVTGTLLGDLFDKHLKQDNK